MLGWSLNPAFCICDTATYFIAVPTCINVNVLDTVFHPAMKPLFEVLQCSRNICQIIHIISLSISANEARYVSVRAEKPR